MLIDTSPAAQLESGEYFMTQEQRNMRKRDEEDERREDKALAKKAKRAAAFIPPEASFGVCCCIQDARHHLENWMYLVMPADAVPWQPDSGTSRAQQSCETANL